MAGEATDLSAADPPSLCIAAVERPHALARERAGCRVRPRSRATGASKPPNDRYGKQRLHTMQLPRGSAWAQKTIGHRQANTEHLSTLHCRT